MTTKIPQNMTLEMFGATAGIHSDLAKRKAEYDALKERAKTDPEAAAEVEAIKVKQRAASNKSNAKKRARMEADPEYAAIEIAKNRERAKKHYAAQKAKMDELKARAEVDPEAAAELEAARKYSSAATIKSRHKLAEQAKTDPEAAAKLRASCGDADR